MISQKIVREWDRTSGFSYRAWLNLSQEVLTLSTAGMGIPCRSLKPDGQSPLMPSTHKKVIVRKMDRDSVSGYVLPTQFVNEGKLELLNTAGNVVAMELREIKGVYFVREFGDSESLTRKTFTSRPRSEGLWVRLRFKDNEILEGLMPADLTQNLPEGYLVNPPDQRSNTQRIFVPRTALESLTVLAVIGAARRPRRGPTEDQRQVPMFEE
jgi:uncharacterized protein DUF6982